MRLDLKRHKLLKILSVNRIKFEAGKLQGGVLGTSFDELSQKMRCDILKFNVIASELYDNNEIRHYNQHSINGVYCENNGITSFSNGKYKARFWQDIWNNLLSISQIIVPIMALLVALIAVLDSRQSREHTEEILQLRKELYKLQETQEYQSKLIYNFSNYILLPKKP